jgi:hypothetical protein
MVKTVDGNVESLALTVSINKIFRLYSQNGGINELVP